jgi:hypothetical protein
MLCLVIVASITRYLRHIWAENLSAYSIARFHVRDITNAPFPSGRAFSSEPAVHPSLLHTLFYYSSPGPWNSLPGEDTVSYGVILHWGGYSALRGSFYTEGVILHWGGHSTLRGSFCTEGVILHWGGHSTLRGSFCTEGVILHWGGHSALRGSF